MDERDKQMVRELKKRLPRDMQKRVRKLIIFGSRARGEGGEDSDLDIVALVDEKTPPIEKALDGAAYSTMWDYDFKPVLSLKVFSEAHFRNAVKRGFSFYRHVEQEGVAV
jgi:uncharacterized protein